MYFKVTDKFIILDLLGPETYVEILIYWYIFSKAHILSIYCSPLVKIFYRFPTVWKSLLLWPWSSLLRLWKKTSRIFNWSAPVVCRPLLKMSDSWAFLQWKLSSIWRNWKIWSQQMHCRRLFNDLILFQADFWRRQILIENQILNNFNVHINSFDWSYINAKILEKHKKTSLSIIKKYIRTSLKTQPM